MIFATLNDTGNEYVFTSELSARRFMSELEQSGLKKVLFGAKTGQFTYWNKSLCEHIVTVKS